MTTKQIFSRNLKRTRLAQQKTQKDIAKFLKINRSTYAYYETGKTSPNIGNLVKIAKFLDVDINFLITENNSDENQEKA